MPPLKTRGDFAVAMLTKLEYPRRQRNLNALVSWMVAEGGPSLDESFNPPQAKFNPLNTTKKMFGSTQFNSVGVQNYTDFEQGVDATVATLLEHDHRYGPIRKHLQANDYAAKTLRAVEVSDWGTGGLASKVLPGVQKKYDAYAQKPIGQ